MKGFSLVELLIATAIVGGISLVLIAALRMGQQSWQAEDVRMSVSQELRRGIDAISRELAATQAAELDEIPATGSWYAGAVVFRVPQDRDGNGTVLDAAGVLEWSDPITYSLGGMDGRQVIRTQVGAADRVIANGVVGIQFRRQAANPSVVEMRLTVRRGGITGEFTNQSDLTTRVRVRN
jgi:prepilin-type N-terminal cleavage/methylation domain-containing protein